MPQRPRKRYYAAKTTALVVLIALGAYLQTHPVDRQAMAETAAHPTDLG